MPRIDKTDKDLPDPDSPTMPKIFEGLSCNEKLLTTVLLLKLIFKF
jgi:hypothetical protein